jgi:hypothetical protein
MNTVSGTMLGLALALGSLACSAQDAKIPIKQLEREAQLSTRASVPANEAAIGRASEAFSGSSSSGFVFVPPAPKPPRTLSKGFLVLNGLHLGMAIFDVEMTQHCIADQHCIEGNPIMPSSHAGQLGVNFALVSYSTFMSYRLKKKDSKLWVLAPTAGIVAHVVGVASGFAHY